MFVKRYRIAELRDGRLLAIDKSAAGAVMLTRRPANGDYKLSRRGVLQVRTGAIVSVRLPAESSGYRIELQRNGWYRLVRVAEPSWELPLSGPGGAALRIHSSRFAILDLTSQGYLLAQSENIAELVATTAFNGTYQTSSGEKITVHNGTASGATIGPPNYQYADDFAP